MKIIGLDVGEKRIGVAKVDSVTRIALPVGFVLNDEKVWEEISRIARLQNTNFFVLGLPRSNEGNETKQTLFVRDFAKHLVEEIPDAKIRFQDESLTSVEAETRLKSRKKKYEKGDIDAEAAAIILQDFIEKFSENELKKTKDDKIEKVDKIDKADKVKLKTKKASSALKKLTIFGIPAVVILILGGVIAGLKIRDYIRWQREEEYRRQEAAMVAEVFNFTIVPGETVFDIRAKLLKAGYSEEAVNEAFLYDYDYDFLVTPRERAIARGNKSQYLEGYLLGETHEFYKSDTPVTILKKFLDGTAQVFSENDLENRYAAEGLTLYEGVTLASVVQKESWAAEMPTVAQVFLTRLDYGMTLGSDVTVTYALDTLDPDRTIYPDNHAALQIDSCYNTRKYAGLPCGPIANPSVTALLAVAEPSDTSYLYFLTGDDGVMYYSYTQAEHDRNARLHCKELCAVTL